MSRNVINLPSVAQYIFVCGCGCSTFTLPDSGNPECAMCGNEADFEGDWYKAPDAPIREDPPVFDVQGNGSVSFAKARVRTLANSPDAKMLVLACEGGAVTVWADYETEEQRKWMLERLEHAADMIRAQRIGDV